MYLKATNRPEYKPSALRATPRRLRLSSSLLGARKPAFPASPTLSALASSLTNGYPRVLQKS